MSIIFLLGPTATGKTALALQLAADFPVEIVSVDSAMIYRGMDIGSGKPSRDELQSVPHHLIDCVDPNQSYSVAEFCCDAKKIISEIKARHHIPLLVGGTMLYFKALKEGLNALPSADASIREKLQKIKDEKGLESLYAQLQHVDKESAARIKPNDPQRIMRALEVYESTGEPLSVWHQKELSETLSIDKNEKILQIALTVQNRAVLHERIEKRFDAMLQSGLIQEVETLKKRYALTKDLPSMRCVGYRQVWQYLEGDLDRETMGEKAIIATRQLAKRQFTWMRSFSDLSFFEVDTQSEGNFFQSVKHYLDENLK